VNLDLSQLKTPCYVIDRAILQKNLDVLADVQTRTRCKILLALKGFAAWAVFDQVRQALAGAAVSSLHEARLAAEYIGKETHLCAPAYRDDEFDEYLKIVDHIIFNSFSQWTRFRPRVLAAQRKIRCGLRLNPAHSEVKTPIYDPCAPGSRLGILREDFRDDLLDGISGLHFHTLCELNADSLERTLKAVEQKFSRSFARLEWFNFGGGHHITRPGYDVSLLCRLITDFRNRYSLEVYLEPGEASSPPSSISSTTTSISPSSIPPPPPTCPTSSKCPTGPKSTAQTSPANKSTPTASPVPPASLVTSSATTPSLAR